MIKKISAGFKKTGGTVKKLAAALGKVASKLKFWKWFKRRKKKSDLLHEEFVLSISRLKRTRFGLSALKGSAIYQLPWFLCIGAHHVGKTSLLRRSGMDYPLFSPQDIVNKGTGGQTAFDWWYANDGVFIDVSGDYSQDSDKHDEWEKYISFFVKHRAKCPLNGVLVMVSFEQLLLNTSQEREKTLAHIRKQLNDVQKISKIDIPVFLVFTKCDVLPGFELLHHAQDPQIRQSAFGIHLEARLTEEEIKDRIKRGLYDSYTQLNHVRRTYLAHSRELTAKQACFDYPEQFRHTFQAIEDIAVRVMPRNNYQYCPTLSGLYFTSSLPNANRVMPYWDREKRSLAFKVVQEDVVKATTREPYYVSGFFRKMLEITNKNFTYSDLVYYQQKRAQRWAFALCAVVTFSCGILWSGAYEWNRRYMRESIALTQTILSEQDGVKKKLIALKSNSALLDHYNVIARDNVNWQKRLGFFKGKTYIKELVQILKTHQQVLFSDPVKAVLKRRIENYQSQWERAAKAEQEAMREPYYAALRAYVALSEPCYQQEIDLVGYYLPIWREVLRVQWELGGQEKLSDSQLRDLIQFYIHHLDASQAPVLAKELKPVRAQLVMPQRDGQQQYQVLVARAKQYRKNLDVSELLEHQAGYFLQSQYKLPALYTRQAFEAYAKPEIDRICNESLNRDWVLGQSNAALQAEVEALKYKVTKTYFEAYAHEWLKFIGAVDTRSFQDIPDATRKLIALTSEEGPLKAFFMEIKNQLEAIPEVYFADSTAIGHLQALLTFCEDPLKEYVKAMAPVREAFEGFSVSMEPGRAAERYCGHLLIGSATDDNEMRLGCLKMDLVVKGVPNARVQQALRPLLFSPIKSAWRIALAEAVKSLELGWKTDVVPHYHRRLFMKYPFGGHDIEANMLEVSDFFHPDYGIFWQFAKERLLSYVEKRDTSYLARTWLDIGPQFSDEFLRFIEYAAVVSEGLFETKGRIPKIQFELAPVPSRQISESTIILDGEAYRYRNEPQEWRKFCWPTETFEPKSEVTAISAATGGKAQRIQEGTWAWFKLLNEAKKMRTQDGEALILEWTLEDEHKNAVPVTFMLRTRHITNPFEIIVWNAFSFPESIQEVG